MVSDKTAKQAHDSPYFIPQVAPIGSKFRSRQALFLERVRFQTICVGQRTRCSIMFPLKRLVDEAPRRGRTFVDVGGNTTALSGPVGRQ